jgi:hypothetical protein
MHENDGTEQARLESKLISPAMKRAELAWQIRNAKASESLGRTRRRRLRLRLREQARASRPHFAADLCVMERSSGLSATMLRQMRSEMRQ